MDGGSRCREERQYKDNRVDPFEDRCELPTARGLRNRPRIRGRDVPKDRERELQLGLGDVAARLAHANVKILNRSRPWPNRSATYFVLGQDHSHSDIVLTDDFVRDLPGTPDYQRALDEYAGQIATRISCGSLLTFYCKSAVPIQIVVRWPVESGVGPDRVFRAWIRVDATDLRNDMTATCAVYVDAMGMQSNRNPFDHLSRLRKNSI